MFGVARADLNEKVASHARLLPHMPSQAPLHDHIKVLDTAPFSGGVYTIMKPAVCDLLREAISVPVLLDADDLECTW